ncbi:hypothetical protein [Caulobacter sp. S45]|jgi:hypothetical protein|uniref:DUF4170 domain-containing protein n=1 Tax=Caulobacter sp. S45 TaxID=1641861 RepID=UPI00131CC5AE|nr:hypothetical protein [Caulobacter sp. S45]
MSKERFWVIGGDYTCTGFKALRGGSQVEGPFESRDEAKAVWKQLSREHSSRATARFSIASEHLVLPN